MAVALMQLPPSLIPTNFCLRNGEVSRDRVGGCGLFAMASNPSATGAEEPKPFLLVLTSPILNFLAAQELKRAENGGIVEEKRMSFWPFAIAGAGLFGLGIAGGNAFMSGSVTAAEEAAASESAPVQEKPGRRRTVLEPKVRSTATNVKVDEALSEANRRGAVRAATASLALGTLLAVTGAAVAVKCTQWYLGVNSAHEFAEYMRSRLPGQAQAVSSAANIEGTKTSLAQWFRDKLGVGDFVTAREAEKRAKDLQVLKEKGALTDREYSQELRRLKDEFPAPASA